MHSFTTPLILEMLPERKWKVMEEFVYKVGDEDPGEEIHIPVGFITDLASIPRIFWNILPPNGRYGKATVIHDYLYANKIKSKEYADNIFLEAMKDLGVGRFKRNFMYYAVKNFGQGNYERKTTDKF